MPTITKTVTVPAQGVGRPDYQGEQWQAKTLKKVELHYNEILKVFAISASAIPSPFSFVVPPLAVGVPTPLIDEDTGLPMPYTVLAGYELEVLMLWSSFDQKAKAYEYAEGFLLSNVFNDAYNIYYENEVLEFSTKWIDPAFALPHIVNFEVENKGLVAMEGLAQVACILRAHHTEKPKSKTIRCKWCGDTTTVPHETTSNNCQKCGKLNLYFAMPQHALTASR